MAQTQTTKLKEIFSEVLADLAFMFTDDEDADLAPGEVWLETSISYEGPNKGTLHFRCAREFTLTLAANLLGVDPEDDEAQLKADDAVKEFMNIVCGQFVTNVFGSHDVYNLSIPTCVELTETPDVQRQNDDDSRATLSVNEGLVQLVHVPDPATA